MNTELRILEGRYVDSVVLMRLAERLTRVAGVEDAAAVMGTPANKALLAEAGFRVPPEAGADDLLVGVKASSDEAARGALEQVDALLVEGGPPGRRSTRTLEQALELDPQINLAAISLPGDHAGEEARRALERGLHVFLFSSNVSVEDEIALKKLATERGLLCMGPDCGTALIAGKGLGFANAVRRGPVGVVGAAGTGIQALTSYLDGFGIGISHAIGCGSRDLSEAVGAQTMLAGLDVLLAHAATEAVVLVSKPPAPSVAARLRERAAAAAKPVICCFLGESGPATLDEAARAAAVAVGAQPPSARDAPSDEKLAELARGLRPAQRNLRGLYAGGTLAYEAQLILRRHGIDVGSNTPLPGGPALDGAAHLVLDMGSEEFTRGRPHPMIDARARRARLVAEADDPSVAVILLDFVLGFGAASDPAGDLDDAIVAAVARNVIVLAFVCGTAGDPQGFTEQQRRLRDAGALVLPTNAAAVETAARLVAVPTREAAAVGRAR